MAERSADMARILVTGGAGFIGCHLCERLVARGHEVVALDDLSLGRRENLASLAGNAAFRLVEGDVLDPAALDALFAAEGFDTVFHMAANSDIARSHADPSIDIDRTFLTTVAVLQAMRRHGAGRIVFASSSAIYGDTEAVIGEDFGPPLPISHYGAAKLASEAFISSFGANYGIRAWLTRFPNVVGDRLTHGAVYDFARKLRDTPGRLEVLGDGRQTKPYLHVDDLVEAMLIALDRLDAPVNIVNIAGETRCSVRRMAEITVEEAGGARIDYTGGDRGWVGDVPNVSYDTSRIRALGWQPRYDSEAAVRAAARWALDSGGA